MKRVGFSSRGNPNSFSGDTTIIHAPVRRYFEYRRFKNHVDTLSRRRKKFVETDGDDERITDVTRLLPSPLRRAAAADGTAVEGGGK